MSNPNFVSDLVAMAKAFEELPQVKQDLSAAKDQEQLLLERIQNNEMRINNLKFEIEQLNAAKAKVEAERDDAEYRFLEGEDRTRSALEFIKSTFGSAGSLIQALEPPAKDVPVTQQADPIPQPPAEQEHRYEPFPTDTQSDAQQPQGQSAVDPTTALTPNSSSEGSESNTSAASVASTSTEGSEVNHVPADPTVHPIQPAASETVGIAETTDGVKTPSSGPYTGKRYDDQPNYIPRQLWLDGGGTEADYDWRPSYPAKTYY